MQGTPWASLGANEQAVINRIRARNGVPALASDPAGRDALAILGKEMDLRVSSATAAENAPLPGQKTEGLPIQGSRNDKAYLDVIKELEKKPMVGGNKGVMDRLEVADAFFAKTDGTPATFLTSDDRVMQGLAKLSPEVQASQRRFAGTPNGTPPKTVKQFLLDNHATGFKAEVTAAGATRTLLVIPAG